MLVYLSAIANYMMSLSSRAHSDEAGQSEVSYLLVVVGVIGIAAVIIAAVVAAVNGYIPKIKL